uniref:Sigma-54-dependent Fis family transcriptional regulator n=1 Tax=Thermodesulfovibrio aggregans TaxID=86166 RepID=A0A7C4EQP1_9BACT
MSNSARIFIVEDDTSFASFLETILKEEGYITKVFNDPEKALKEIREFSPEVVITDLKMPKMDGIKFIEKARDFLPDTEFIVITAFGTIPSAVEAMKKGAIDYITKPLSSPEIFLEIIGNTLKKKTETQGLPPNEILFAGIEDVYRMIKEAAKTDTTLILYGETGTGKSAIAKAIHIMSGRKGSFIEINCASIPETLIESELFGYEKGAFSGAFKQKPGKIELANNGTLFLDEIGELSMAVQAKLLKVLQDKSFERVGGVETIKTNVRFITATNRDLREMVKEGRFRQDLYFRINVFPLHIPPLRERRAHIQKIAEYLADRICFKLGKKTMRLSNSSMQILKTYSFPGNIRELENMLERAIILSKKDEIDIKIEGYVNSEKGELKAVEKKTIIDALRKTGGNKKKASEILGISLRTLYYKIKEYGLK